MKRTAVIPFILSFMIPFTNLLAQNHLTSGVIETQGNILFSYSNKIWAQYRFNNGTLDMYFREYDVIFQPSIGYFLSENWELLLLPQFSISATKQNYIQSTDGPEEFECTRSYHNYGLGMVTGLAFHFPLSHDVISFLNMSGGMSWVRFYVGDYSVAYPGYSYLSPWSKPVFTFPNISFGLKIFLVDNWALIPSVNLTYTVYPEHYQLLRIYVGVGFAVYLHNKNGS